MAQPDAVRPATIAYESLGVAEVPIGTNVFRMNGGHAETCALLSLGRFLKASSAIGQTDVNNASAAAVRKNKHNEGQTSKITRRKRRTNPRPRF